MGDIQGAIPFDTIRLEMDTEGRYRMYFVHEDKDLHYIEVPMPVRGRSLTVSNLKGEVPVTLRSY